MQEETALRKRAEAGEVAACDELATALYERGRHQESADLYLKAYIGGFYKKNDQPTSEQNFFGMIDRGLIPADSDAARLVRQLRQRQESVGERARKAAGRAGIATFIVYMGLVFGAGVPGILRDFSLIIAGGLAWLVWRLVLSSFEE